MKTLGVILLIIMAVVIIICLCFIPLWVLKSRMTKLEKIKRAEDELKVLERTKVNKLYGDNDEFDYGHDIKNK